MLTGPQNPFTRFILDQLFPLGSIRVKRMFGSQGLYQEGVMFALISDDCLYVKADERTLPGYLAQGMWPLTYERQGKTIALSFYSVPEELLEDREALLNLVRQAMAAAHRSKPRASSTIAEKLKPTHEPP